MTGHKSWYHKIWNKICFQNELTGCCHERRKEQRNTHWVRDKLRDRRHKVDTAACQPMIPRHEDTAFIGARKLEFRAQRSTFAGKPWLIESRQVEVRNLLPRQLWHLALADLFWASMKCPIWANFVLPSDAVDTMTPILLASVNSGAVTCISLELHVAAGVAALHWRASGFMHFLSNTLWCCWLIGVGVGVLDFAQNRCETRSACTTAEGYTSALCCCLTCVTYGVTAFRALRFPEGQERRAHKVVCVYLLSYVITLLPYQISVMLAAPTTDSLRIAAEVLLKFNGFLNVQVYALNESLARGTVWSADVAAVSNIAAVDFAQRAGKSNVRVGFSVVAHELNFVASVQQEALRRSEAAMEGLKGSEAEHTDED